MLVKASGAMKNARSKKQHDEIDSRIEAETRAEFKKWKKSVENGVPMKNSLVPHLDEESVRKIKERVDSRIRVGKGTRGVAARKREAKARLVAKARAKAQEKRVQKNETGGGGAKSHVFN